MTLGMGRRLNGKSDHAESHLDPSETAVNQTGKCERRGERGDSNPRIAAPQAAALTTWRRPPWFNELTTRRADAAERNLCQPVIRPLDRD